MNVEAELDRLYALPLERFTEARNALAGALRKAGERDEAERVKALPKPSISAWVVNQLARQERLQMRSLLTAGEHLREAQENLLRGGDRSELHEASERQRLVVAALMESAEEVLRSAGHPATPATLERVRGTLGAAAGDDGKRLIREGRLSGDLDPTGFGPLVAVPGAARTPSTPRRTHGKPERESKARARRIEQAAQELEAVRAEVRQRKADAERAQAEARSAARSAEAAKKAAAKAEKELEQVSARLEAAKEALARARSS